MPEKFLHLRFLNNGTAIKFPGHNSAALCGRTNNMLHAGGVPGFLSAFFVAVACR